MNTVLEPGIHKPMPLVELVIAVYSALMALCLIGFVAAGYVMFRRLRRRNPNWHDR